jgi:hypothetical protein
VGIPDPKIPETVFKVPIVLCSLPLPNYAVLKIDGNGNVEQTIKWEPLSIERSENADIKEKLHKMFYIKDAKKLGGKKGAGTRRSSPV